MRSLYCLVVALGLGIGLGACRESNPGGDDAVELDAGIDAPGDGCTAFSPRMIAPEPFVGPTGLQARMTSLIDSAQTTLDVQMYLFTVTALADRIIAAHNRGVTVRVLLDPDHEGNVNVRERLTNAGVPTRNAPNLYTFSHAKYLIVDGDTAAIMSMNFNVDAMNNERNYGVIDRDPADLADLQAIFDMDWAAAAGEPVQPADLSCTRLVVSPNNAKLRIMELINKATRTLDVEAFYISESGVRDAIIAAHQRGVAVRVILQGSGDDSGTIPMLRAAGITVHDSSSFFNHAKLVIADGIPFVGSENFSITALTRNREVGVFVVEPAAAAVVQQQFDTDWANTN